MRITKNKTNVNKFESKSHGTMVWSNRKCSSIWMLILNWPLNYRKNVHGFFFFTRSNFYIDELISLSLNQLIVVSNYKILLNIRINSFLLLQIYILINTLFCFLFRFRANFRHKLLWNQWQVWQLFTY